MKKKTLAQILFSTLGAVAERWMPDMPKIKVRKKWPTMVTADRMTIFQWNQVADMKREPVRRKLAGQRLARRTHGMTARSQRRNAYYYRSLELDRV